MKNLAGCGLLLITLLASFSLARANEPNSAPPAGPPGDHPPEPPGGFHGDHPPGPPGGFPGGFRGAPPEGLAGLLGVYLPRSPEGHDHGADWTDRKPKDTLMNHYDALSAREAGEIVPLKDALSPVKRTGDTVIEVKLFKDFGDAVYRIKLRDIDGAIRTVRVDAHTGKQRNFF